MRIGLIGAGRFGRLHLRVLRQIPGVTVAAAADVNPEMLQALEADFGIAPEGCSTDPAELLLRDDLDAVDIVSDESSHGPLVLEALRRGKHVIVEKPLSVKADEARAILAAQQASGRQVLVGNISRFSQPYYTIKRSIETGRLGRVAAIRSKRDFSRSWFHGFGNRVHPVYESGVHELDLMVWYTGCRCIRVSAMESHPGGYTYPDLFSAVLEFDNGIIASLDSGWMVPGSAPQNLTETLELDGTIDARIEVVGEAGTASYQLAHSGLSLWLQEGMQQPETTLWPTAHDGIGGAIRAELEHFAAMIAGNTPSPVMPLEDSVHVLEIADAIAESARTRRMIEIPPWR